MRKERERSKWKKSTQINWVYFIQSGKNGPIKIGLARSIQKRLETMQTGNPYELRLITSVHCDSRAQAESLEKHFHRLFARKRLRGEWFRSDINIKSLRDTTTPTFTDEEIDELYLVQSAKVMQ